MKQDGRVVAVTGAAGGIGRAIAGRLAADGARVFSLDVCNFEGDEAESIHCDVRDDNSVRSAIEAIREKAGRLDAVVHAAGTARDAVIWKLDVDDWDLVQSVNLRGAFLLLRHSVPLMRANGYGRIVLIGSINGSRGKRGTAAYSASKAGLIGLAKTVARETGRFGITANVVEPGWVRTPLTEALPAEICEAARAETVSGELVEPADVAALVGFLCSTDAGRITGQVVRVDSGQFLGGS